MKTKKIGLHLSEKEGFSVYERSSALVVTWSTEVRYNEFWGKNLTLVLSTDIAQDGWKAPVPECDYNVGLLKSALQKSIRLCKSSVSTNLCWQLLCQDGDALLRRLPIIILEDACLCPQFCELVWLMVAQSKGWKLTRKQVLLVLESVFQISEMKWRDPVPSFKIEKFQNPVLKENSPLIRPFLVSIILRMNNGGMKGDMEMLQKFTIIWHERYSKNAEFWAKERDTWFAGLDEKKSQLEELISTGPILSDNDKISEGIDFHCFPKLLERCANDLKDPTITKDEIKQCVWFHRSGINFKKPVCDPNDPYTIKINDSLESETSSRKETQQNWDKISPIWLKLCDKTYWTPIKINF